MAAATAAIGTAAVAAGKKLWDMASETAKAGDEIDKTSQKLGMSAEAYQEWDYVLGQAGVDITSMTTGLKTMTNQIDDAKNGSVKAQERFAKLGISLNDLNTMSHEDIFSAVVSGMQGMADTTERAALANDLFGKSGQNLTPLFNETTESTEKLKQAAHELGFVMSDEAVKASAEFNDSLDTLKRTFSGVKNNLVGELLPGFSTLLNGLSALLAGNDNAKEQIQKGTQEIVDSLKDIFPRVMDILMTLIGAVAEIAPVIIDSLVQGISANMGELVSAASDIVITFLESLNLILQTTYRDNHINKKTLKNNGQLPKFQVIEAHEPIIAVDDYCRVQEEIQRRSESQNRIVEPGNTYPFTSLITCQHCGKHYRRKTRSSGHFWICTTYNAKGKAACPSKQIHESALIESTEDIESITAITACDDNILLIKTADGSEYRRRWAERSRADSWTPEMKAKASKYGIIGRRIQCQWSYE